MIIHSKIKDALSIIFLVMAVILILISFWRLWILVFTVILILWLAFSCYALYVKSHLKEIGYQWLTLGDVRMLIIKIGFATFKLPPSEQIEILPDFEYSTRHLIMILRKYNLNDNNVQLRDRLKILLNQEFVHILFHSVLISMLSFLAIALYDHYEYFDIAWLNNGNISYIIFFTGVYALPVIYYNILKSLSFSYKYNLKNSTNQYKPHIIISKLLLMILIVLYFSTWIFGIPNVHSKIANQYLFKYRQYINSEIEVKQEINVTASVAIFPCIILCYKDHFYSVHAGTNCWEMYIWYFFGSKKLLETQMGGASGIPPKGWILRDNLNSGTRNSGTEYSFHQ